MNMTLFDDACKDVAKSATKQLAESIVAKTDDVIRDAITRYLGNEWAVEELVGRMELMKLPSGVEILSLDGVALLELHPLVVATDINGAGEVRINATRQHRFLRNDK